MQSLKCVKNQYDNCFNQGKIFLSDFENIEKRKLKNKGELYDIEKLKKSGIEQGNIGDCFLIAAIISILTSYLSLIKNLFPNINYDEDTEKIEMFIFMDGFRTLITFKNSYAVTKNNKLIFSRPKNNEFALLCIEKGYVVAKSDKKTIKSGYKTLNRGGQSCNVLYDLLGTKCDDIYLSYGDKMK